MFFVLAVLLIPLPGIQNDEAIFAVPLWTAPARIFSIGTRHHLLQVMLMSYLGALKSFLYKPIFWVFKPSVWSLRIPVVILCLFTICLTWLYTKRIAGWHAAIIVTILLATDPSFLLTGTLDWGPVALQHCLLMLGLVSLLQWLDSGWEPMLVFSFFVFGLGLWDKALFVWPLSGLALSALCVYPRQVIRHLRTRSVLLAIGGVCLGAMPLIAYNLQHGGATVRQNSHFTGEGFQTKIDSFRKTLNGSIMFDVLPPESRSPYSVAANIPEQASEWLKQHTGDHHRTHFVWVIATALLITIVTGTWAERRSMIFLLLAVCIGFFEMLIAEGAVSAAHHDVLLWPLPMMLVAIPFGRVVQSRWRIVSFASIIIVALSCTENLLTDNQYLAAYRKDGNSQYWTDAIFPLSDWVQGHKRQHYEIVDWGYANSLVLLTQGQVNLDDKSFCLANSSAPGDPECNIPELLIRPDTLYIQHTRDNQIFPSINQHLERIAAAHGVQEQVDQVIPDSHSRPMFQIIHFVPFPNASSGSVTHSALAR